MRNLRQDGIYLLLGITVTLAVLAAIGTIAGVLLSIGLTIAPGPVASSWRDRLGQQLAFGVLLAALLQTAGWMWLPRSGFVSWTWSRRIRSVMIAIGIFMFAMLLFSL